MAISMYRLSSALLLGLVAMLSTTVTVRAGDPAPAASSDEYQSLANAGWAAVEKEYGTGKDSSGTKLAVANSGDKAQDCAFYITNKCKSKKSLYFTSGSKGKWGQLVLGTFYLKYGKTSKKLIAQTTAYLRLSPNAKFPNAGTATFCSLPRIGLFTYYYSSKLGVWGSFVPGTDIIKDAGYTCGSIGGKLLGGYQRLKTCGQRIVVTKC